MEQEQVKNNILSKKRKKRARRWFSLLLLLVALGATGWYFFLRQEPDPKPVIRFAAVERGDIVKSISATGTVQATKTVQVGSQISGTIKALNADFNSKVEKNEIVAIIDPTFYEAAVSEAKANYQNAMAQYDNALKDAARNDELFKKALIAKSDYDASTTKVKVAEATVAQNKAALDRANVNLGYTVIRSPISGVVVSRNVDVGQTVAASLNAPVLFTIAEDLTKMEVDVSVDEADVGQVKLGEETIFTVDAFSGEKFSGKVSMVRISPTTVQNVVTYTVVVSAENKDLKLLPGMTATTTIISEERDSVLRIPSAALKFRPPQPVSDTSKSERRDWQGRGMAKQGGAENFGILFKKKSAGKDNTEVTFEPVKVRTGLSDGMYTEVMLRDEAALSVGDSIAIGSVNLSPGKAQQTNQPGASPFGGGTQRPPGGMRRL
jgi:HlyD family secretion protein